MEVSEELMSNADFKCVLTSFKTENRWIMFSLCNTWTNFSFCKKKKKNGAYTNGVLKIVLVTNSLITVLSFYITFPK